MVVIAESYLQYHEKNAIDAALKENPAVAPKSFVRYARFPDLQSATAFQNILNQQDPENIKYTMDVENTQKSLQFLDLNITNNNTAYTNTKSIEKMPLKMSKSSLTRDTIQKH